MTDTPVERGTPQKIYIIDMRQPGEVFCADCPDHAACSAGYACEMVKEINAV